MALYMTLRARIFISMIAVIVTSSIFMALITIYHFKKENEAYHKERLERKEEAIRSSIDYLLWQNELVQNPDSIVKVFDEKICEIADVNNLNVNIYSLSGDLLITSDPETFEIMNPTDKIGDSLLKALTVGQNRVVKELSTDTAILHSTYSYIRNSGNQPVAIVNIPYIQTDTYHKHELQEFLKSLAQIYILLIIATSILAYFLSNGITKSLATVSAQFNKIGFQNKNQHIDWKKADEIGTLVSAYNRMVDELDESAEKLAQSEREMAWSKMARQIAHEIKNPLTPMKLSVQQLQRTLKKEDDNWNEKLEAFTRAMIEQIDTLTNIANSFSNYASMPGLRKETFALYDLLSSAIELFDHATVHLEADEAAKKLMVYADREQLIRVMNNLLNNAIQAAKTGEETEIRVILTSKDNFATVQVIDNGVGIPSDRLEKIFEPNFTTKTSGTGLGLAIVRRIIENCEGKITVESTENVGSCFTFRLPLV
jgi:two-component system, NtrC family, nitrogen regulation sensor histidine kinase NtrY